MFLLYYDIHTLFPVVHNISFRLQSGRKRYIEKGGKLGRKVGSVKTTEQMKVEYMEVISLLRKGYSIRDVAKLSGVQYSE